MDKSTSMKQIIFKIFNFFGVSIIKTSYLKKLSSLNSSDGPIFENKNSLIGNAFNLLKSKGFNPKHVIDIGANHGTWVREVLHIFPKANYTLVEPQGWLSSSFADLLENKNFSFLPVGVGKETGTFMFTIVDRDDSCNFVMTEEDAKKYGFKQLPIEVKTVNEIVKNSTFGIPDLLKIDAEGLDLEVLDGATDVLGITDVVLMEASVVNPHFKNDIKTVIQYMDEKGYVLFDITDLNRPFDNKVLWLVELLFIKKSGKFSNINWISNPS
jgi:FkbM family methyltransferase